MKKLFFILIICLTSIGFSGCEEGDKIICNPCDCSIQSSTSVNCYGTTQSDAGCNNNTLNSCGYCYLHTGQCCD